MSSWFDRGRPAIFEALQQVCDKIGSDLETELQQRDVEQHAFLTKEVERLRARAATVEKLEQENRALTNEVTALRAQVKSASARLDQVPVASATPLSKRQPLGEISANTPNRLTSNGANQKVSDVETVPAATFRELQEDYAKVANTCEQLRRVKDASIAAARKHQEEKQRWETYAGKLEARLEKRKKADRMRGAQPQSSADPRRPSPVSQELIAREVQPSDAGPVPVHRATPLSTVRPLPSATASFSGFENTGLPDSSPRRATSSPPDARSAKADAHPHSDSTEGDDDAGEQSLPQLPPNETGTSVTIKNEPSSDLPVVVSERHVGKRKRTDDPEGDVTPRRIKTENWSSDPLVTGESHHFLPQESMDLDNDGAMPTPRKIRTLQMQNRIETTRPDHDTIHEDSGIFDMSPATTTVQSSRTAVSDLHVYAGSTVSPLSTTSGNRSRVRETGSKLKHGVASLAEDGYDPTRPERQEHTGLQTTDAPSRLNTLLNAPSSPLPQHQTPLLRPNRQSREPTLSSPWLTETPVRVLPFGKGDGRQLNTPAASNLKVAGDPKSAQASTTAVPRLPMPPPPVSSKAKATTKRLRDQPLSSLSLDSFKINPKFNNGHNFAFTEVVRNKDERAEIPGCVDPNCCGKHFRAMAQSELEAAGPSLIHRAADIALLEDFLGDQVYKLGSMTRQEKEELWLEAKTRELANKHGKHRHRFTRRQSPPGFWNADFPSTQENQKDREEGEKRVKRMIEERYREAMRRGGRWLFRDE